ncbi:glutathione S-transferase N-terminal domain-containing protein [Granulosicoccus sp. 3-233]|uniref:glutathione S-transferase N-terminal domain-containing protein n=1 Tax=Granulosicoccus sp. 3-233 TaxID=3417969 RepID=UPI003D34D8BB
MVLYSDASSIHSHRVRLVLAEKDLVTDVRHLDPGKPDEEFSRLNPSGHLPTLIDRELLLYDARVIIDYLDERYPHPPMMPVDPVSRARTRLALYRIGVDWYSLRPDAVRQDKNPDEAAAMLAESLVAASDVFAAMPYFFSEEYSILDATLAPLLWRLPAYGIVLPEAAAPVMQYARRMFARPGFQASLSVVEREMEHS